MKPRLQSVQVCGAFVALMVACTATPTEPNMSTREVSITSSGFVPRTVTISAGQSVTWINNDNSSHSVDSGTFMNPTSDFNSPNLEPGGEPFQERFTVRGTFPYYCSIHQTGNVKEGTITVN